MYNCKSVHLHFPFCRNHSDIVKEQIRYMYHVRLDKQGSVSKLRSLVLCMRQAKIKIVWLGQVTFEL